MGPRAAPSSHPHRGGGDETAYARRRPEESVLYGAVQSELEGFLFRAQAHERPVPRFVERELRGFLGCGILAHGFVRVHCRLLYRLKHPWRDGATHVLFERLELLEKLAALVPPPRFHLVRYHGILGPCAGERDRVVPAVEEAVGEAPTSDAVDPAWPGAAGSDPRVRASASDVAPNGSEPAEAVSAPLVQASPEPPRLERPRRLAWAELLRRVFAVDVLECPRCGSRTRILAAIHPPDTTRAILECLALPSRAPPADANRPDDD